MSAILCLNDSRWCLILLISSIVFLPCNAKTSIAEQSTKPSNSRDHRDESASISKYVSPPSDVVLEHVDFVSLRLRHVMNQTSSNLTEILEIQREEFLTNSIYKDGWEEAKRTFKTTTRLNLEHLYGNDSFVLVAVPEEYHIALVAYTMQWPAVYSDFNEQTRQLCSHHDIVSFKYKSYFKLLELATESLGKYLNPGNKKPNRFLYRGVSKSFALKEGQQLAFQHFISTSVKQSIAEVFSSGSSVFEFDDDSKASLGVYLGSHSVFAGEEEVLLSPLQVFRVDSIHTGYHYTRYVLKAKATADKDQDSSYACGDCEMTANNSTVTKLVTTVTILASIIGVISILCVIVGAVVFVKKSRLSWSWSSTSTESGLQLT